MRGGCGAARRWSVPCLRSRGARPTRGSLRRRGTSGHLTLYLLGSEAIPLPGGSFGVTRSPGPPLPPTARLSPPGSRHIELEPDVHCRLPPRRISRFVMSCASFRHDRERARGQWRACRRSSRPPQRRRQRLELHRDAPNRGDDPPGWNTLRFPRSPFESRDRSVGRAQPRWCRAIDDRAPLRGDPSGQPVGKFPVAFQQGEKGEDHSVSTLLRGRSRRRRRRADRVPSARRRPEAYWCCPAGNLSVAGPQPLRYVANQWSSARVPLVEPCRRHSRHARPGAERTK